MKPPRRSKAQKQGLRGVPVMDARRLLLGLPNVVEGRSYGSPSFLLNGRFLARFRDDDTVLVLQLATIGEREALMELDPGAFRTSRSPIVASCRTRDRKSTRLNSSHGYISYAVFCLKKKNKRN